MKKPHNVMYLRRAVRHLFDTDEKAYRMRVMMANVVIGQILPDGVVRGGTSMKLRYGHHATRFTMDFDAAQRLDVEEFERRLAERLKTGWDDFSGRIVPAPRAKSALKSKLPEDYLMTPFFVKLAFRNQPWCTVKLEVSFNEIGDADRADPIPVPQEVRKVFAELGFPEPNPIPAMTLEYQIAQKVHGMTKIGNHRVQDLVDLQLIAKHEKIPYKKVGAVCRRLFAYRKQQIWPSNVAYGPDWESLYAEAAKGVDVFQTLDEAIPWGNDFIAKIVRYSRPKGSARRKSGNERVGK